MDLVDRARLKRRALYDVHEGKGQRAKGKGEGKETKVKGEEREE
jgi:hypothetical protein